MSVPVGQRQPMRVVVFGATGPTGRHLISQALAAGHEVTAVSRDPAALPPRPGLTISTADALDPAAVEEAVSGAESTPDAVLSALGTRFSRKEVRLYSDGTANIVAAMHRAGVDRLLVVSSSVLDPQWRPSNAFFFNNVLDPLFNRHAGRTVHDDMRRMETLVSTTDLAWTLVRPSGLFDHPTITRYTRTNSPADGLFTARADLAAAMLAELTENDYVRKPMSVITTQARPNIAKLLWREATTRRGTSPASHLKPTG
jgi:putative NADH-flavin reductase